MLLKMKLPFLICLSALLISALVALQLLRPVDRSTFIEWKFVTSDEVPSKVVFIKTHKTGSSTLTNILIRYGVRRNMSFLVRGDCCSYLGKAWTDVYPPFSASSSKNCSRCSRDILAFHSIYDNSWMRDTFRKAKFVILLRDPVTRAFSEYYYENIGKAVSKAFKLRQFSATLEQVCGNETLKSFVAGKLRTLSRQLGNSSRYNLAKKKTFLRDEFHLVGITERFDETLAALRLMLNVNVSEVVYERMKVSPHLHNLTAETKECLRDMVHEDVQLYEYGKGLFEEQLLMLGLTHGRLTTEASQLQDLAAHLSRECDGHLATAEKPMAHAGEVVEPAQEAWCAKRFSHKSKKLRKRCQTSLRTFNWTKIASSSLNAGSAAWCELLRHDIEDTLPFLIWWQEEYQQLV